MGAGDVRRRIPSVDALLRAAAARRTARSFGRPVVRLALREVLDEVRAGAKATPPQPVPPDEVILARAVGRAARTELGVRAAINATGVLLHTGLGRAPLGRDAVRALGRVAGRYADVEVDRETGRREPRTAAAEYVLRALTGAEAALVVNNNAGALLLALAALARRREVVVSRGELIEIGGDFRLPDIMGASGAKLVEVGTTNRTSPTDYERAIGERTALALKVHPSNYRVTGFTRSVEVGALAALAHARGVPVLHDLGSGLLTRLAGVPPDEPAAAESLAAGADLVCFSGDKLLGGPQAGILLGRSEMIEKLRRHPLARALRVDVLAVAALQATLRAYATDGLDRVPFWRAARASRAEIRRRAAALAGRIGGATVVPTEA
ncbi:MAG TPA: L-seryl-tRNA(Sec) selenium transferase, partial [Actinomycetota bacterium]|nr:L-seryl-tRNA(Sec) selenium transferase [Actinomycetota bacterium]